MCMHVCLFLPLSASAYAHAFFLRCFWRLASRLAAAQLPAFKEHVEKLRDVLDYLVFLPSRHSTAILKVFAITNEGEGEGERECMCVCVCASLNKAHCQPLSLSLSLSLP